MTEYKLTQWGFEAPKKEIIKTSTGDVMIIYPETVNRAKQGDEYITSILLSIMETLYYNKLIASIPLQYRGDAIQTCHVAILEALQKFDFDKAKNCKFETFAMQYCRMYIAKYLQEMESICKMSKEARAALYEDMSADVDVMEGILNPPKVKTKQKPVSKSLQSQLKALYNIDDIEYAEAKDKREEQKAERETVQYSISFKGLNEREKQIIIDYYLNGISINDLAKQYGVSVRRVRQIRTVARTKMKNKNNYELFKKM